MGFLRAGSSSTAYRRMPQADTPTRVPAELVVITFICGAVLASLPPVRQDALEGSLVLAGIVHYQPQSAMGLYYYGVWTLLHQVGAVSLLAGIPPRFLDQAFAVLPVAIRCAGYAMLIWGFSKNSRFAFAAALTCYASGFLLATFSAPEYPVAGLLGVPDQYTYGIFGYSLAAWIFGAIAGGRWKLAGFSSAILISIHPMIGAYMAFILVAPRTATRGRSML